MFYVASFETSFFSVTKPTSILVKFNKDPAPTDKTF